MAQVISKLERLFSRVILVPGNRSPVTLDMLVCEYMWLLFRIRIPQASARPTLNYADYVSYEA
jgi:hypothetical protein